MGNPIDLNELAEFLSASNKETYANKEAKLAESTRLSSNDYHFKKDNLIYHDTYFGPRDFIGEEIVYKDKKPVWGANYYGFIFKDSYDKDEVYDFLRQALMQEYDDAIPVRGPKEFIVDNWKYINKPEGRLDRFVGIEEIAVSDEIIYRAYYHGGFIR